ncbi:hypothetical protein ACIBH1_44850 [Nonomuraea sp. NPDC050663]|uniref:hypothetical protein n=1 Tax=Nonomuraea sp. NPDC050663 TaxID=3364370 RepID=UPI00379FC5FA
MSATKPEPSTAVSRVNAEHAPEPGPELTVRVECGGRAYTLTLTEGDERHQVEVVGVDEHGQVVAELHGWTAMSSADATALSQLFAAAVRLEREPVTHAQRRTKHGNSHRAWSEQDDQRLRVLASAPGASITALMEAFGRSRDAIRRRLEKVGIDPDSVPYRL